jgi:hypothetical protein
MACRKVTEHGTRWIAVSDAGVIAGEFYTLRECLQALGRLS